MVFGMWSVLAEQMNESIANGDISRVRHLLNSGFQVNGPNMFAAVQSQNLEVLKLFLDSGANPNMEYDGQELYASAFDPSPEHKTPLAHGVLLGGKIIINLLLLGGAQVLPHHLFVAIQSQQHDVLKLLLDTGVNIDVEYNGKKIATHASEDGNVRVRNLFAKYTKSGSNSNLQSCMSEKAAIAEDLLNCKVEKGTLQEDLRALNEQFNDLSAELVMLRGKNSSLETSLETFREQISSLEQQLSSSSDLNESLRREIELMRDQVSRLEEELGDARPRKKKAAEPSPSPSLPDGQTYPGRVRPREFKPVDPTRQEAYIHPPPVHGTPEYQKGERVYRDYICTKPWNKNAKGFKYSDRVKSCTKVARGTGDYFNRDHCNVACQK